MRTETTRIFTDLLSLHGHPADPVPTSLEGTSMNLFKSLWLLGGLQSIDLRVGDDDEPTFGPTYGNDLASKRIFGKTTREAPEFARRQAKAPVANDQHLARC